jgi:hypothetical protein
MEQEGNRRLLRHLRNDLQVIKLPPLLLLLDGIVDILLRTRGREIVEVPLLVGLLKH